MPFQLQTIVDEHYQNLYRFALSLTRSRDDAWDLTQEAFLRLAKKRSSIRSPKAVKSWLYTTLYREFLRLAKRSSRFDSWEEATQSEEHSSDRVEQIMKTEANDVMEALMRLKNGYRQVVSLYYLESYSYKEIAEILEIPIGTVMSRLSRGKDVLKTCLEAPVQQSNIVRFSGQQRKVSND